jgi:hypothetical protein
MDGISKYNRERWNALVRGSALWRDEEDQRSLKWLKMS